MRELLYLALPMTNNICQLHQQLTVVKKKTQNKDDFTVILKQHILYHILLVMLYVNLAHIWYKVFQRHRYKR